MAEEDVDRRDWVRRWKGDPVETEPFSEPFPAFNPETSLEQNPTASDGEHLEATGEERRDSVDTVSPGSISPGLQGWGAASPSRKPGAPWIAAGSSPASSPGGHDDVAALQRSGSPISSVGLPPSNFFSGRRSSIGTVASTTSAGTFRSNRTNFSRPRRRPDVLKDIYMTNPKILRSRDGENGPEYGLWTSETATLVKILLTGVTEPPRNGMFQRIDAEDVLRTHMANSDAKTHAPWEQLLACYDVAMRGRSAAFLVLADMSKKFLEEEGRGNLETAVRKAEEEKETLGKVVEFLEAEKRQRLEEIASLETTNRILLRDRSALEADQDKIMAMQKERLQRLEKKMVDWGERVSLPIIRLSASDRGDDEPRFEAILNALEEARRITETTDDRLKVAEDECDELHKMVSDVTDLRVSQLDLQNQELKKQLESERARAAKREKHHAEVAARLSQSGLRNQELKSVLEAERARVVQTEKDDAEIIARLISQNESQKREKDLGDTRMKQEAALYRNKCETLQRTVDELKQKIADQAVEAVREKKEYERRVEEIKDSIEGLQTTVTGGIGGLQGGPNAGSPPSSPRAHLLPKEAIHEIKATQIQTIQSSQAIMEEIREAIRGVVDRVSAGMAKSVGIDFNDAQQQIMNELQKLTVSADSWISQHQTFEQNQALMHGELDSLRQMLQSNQHTFQEIEQQLQRHYAQVKTAKMTSQEGKDWEMAPTASLDGTIPSKDLSFGASIEEIQCLRAGREIIRQLRSPPETKEAGMGLDALVGSRTEMLHQLWQRLGEVDPNTPAEDLIIELETTLRSFQAYGIEKDLTAFYGMLGHFDTLFEGLLKLKQYTTQPRRAERDLLWGIQSKIEHLEGGQDTLARLTTEHEAYRTKQSLRPPSSRQWEELLLLTSNFLQANGDIWSLPTSTREEGAAALERLVSQVQEMMADSDLAKRRREIQNAMMEQDSRLVALGTEIPKVKRRANDLMKRVAAFDRVQLRGFRASAPNVKPMDLTLRAALKRHETRLRRDYDFSKARLDKLHADQAQSQGYLDGAAAAERQSARESVIRALLQLQASRGTGRHGEATCFCALFRYFFPRGYYSVVTGGCCAGGKTNASSPSAPSCHGHHGHGVLISSGPLWTSLCRFLTSIIWVLFLVFYQPSELGRMASFLLRSLLAPPIYVFRLAEHIYTRIRHRVSTTILLATAYLWLTYVAVTVERRIWVGSNDWRFAYVRDLTSGRPPPYPAWSPVSVDYRLATDPVWVWFAEGVHGLFGWRRGMGLELDGGGGGGVAGEGV
ncbi:uncharacterized protein B0H64DRAFT_453629 [Chaetomium fimeti]|uniref:Uncharacterized protein n=1 Tax=Chaetomium fimeti TaxID=1854472 RepID=A0AAE0LV17_9PEZI|nr:hypothetical protein B0H64DRAFT_453629 [Chaetomium fimeti]